MRGFVISWFYPPINSSEGLVTFKLLNKSNISHDVYTQKDSSIWSYNSDENALRNENIKTIFGDSESFEKWSGSCVNYFNEHHAEYDFIMSRSMPPDSHVAAQAIKKRYPSIKWVASFGDPIYGSPYTKLAENLPIFNSDFPRLPNPRYFIALLKRQAKKQLWYYQARHDRRTEAEKKILEYNTLVNADAVIFNNSYQRDFMLEQHGLKSSSKYVILPHTYEPVLYEKTEKKEHTGKVVFSHIGHLDLIRSPINFLKATSRLKDKRPDLYEKLDLNFYGILDSMSKVYIVDNDLHQSVHVHKPVSYFDSLKIMKTSNWCLLVDANLSTQIEKNIYFAAKLADYLGSKTPIFAVSMIEGASADIIRKTGNILSSHSIDEIYMMLTLTLEGKISTKTPEEVRRGFEAKSVAKVYDQLISTVLANKG